MIQNLVIVIVYLFQKRQFGFNLLVKVHAAMNYQLSFIAFSSLYPVVASLSRETPIADIAVSIEDEKILKHFCTALKRIHIIPTVSPSQDPDHGKPVYPLLR
jgi:hypothetical protein